MNKSKQLLALLEDNKVKVEFNYTIDSLMKPDIAQEFVTRLYDYVNNLNDITSMESFYFYNGQKHPNKNFTEMNASTYEFEGQDAIKAADFILRWFEKIPHAKIWVNGEVRLDNLGAKDLGADESNDSEETDFDYKGFKIRKEDDNKFVIHVHHPDEGKIDIHTADSKEDAEKWIDQVHKDAEAGMKSYESKESFTVYLKKDKHQHYGAKELGTFDSQDKAMEFVKNNYSKEQEAGLIEINPNDMDPAGGYGAKSHESFPGYPVEYKDTSREDLNKIAKEHKFLLAPSHDKNIVIVKVSPITTIGVYDIKNNTLHTMKPLSAYK